MDEMILRQNAINLASGRVAPTAPTEDLIAEAEKILAWTKGGSASSSASPIHESQAAVSGEQKTG